MPIKVQRLPGGEFRGEQSATAKMLKNKKKKKGVMPNQKGITAPKKLAPDRKVLLLLKLLQKQKNVVLVLLPISQVRKKLR